MFERIRQFLVVPACLLVASPLFVITLTAGPVSVDQAATVMAIPAIEESTRSIGLPQPEGDNMKIVRAVKLNPVPHVFSYQPFGRSSKFVSDTFRGLTRRATGTWRFDQVLGRHEIELKSDPYEMVNIQLAADAVDGSVVMPGDTFSFNGEVGVRSEEKGYKPGLMFQQGQVIKGVGGGICIVSTGLYNAALKAGFKIIDRSPHSGVPRYAGPGFDAAVVYGILDLKVKNDTKSPFLIRAEIEDDILAITLLGQKTPGVEVELTTADYKELPYKIFEKPDPSIPEGELLVKQKAKPGFEVSTVRIFRKNGKIVKQEVVAVSHYAPRNKIILIPVTPEGEKLTPEDPATVDQPADAAVETTEPVKPLKIEKPEQAQSSVKTKPLPKKWDVEPVKPEVEKDQETTVPSAPEKATLNAEPHAHPSDTEKDAMNSQNL